MPVIGLFLLGGAATGAWRQWRVRDRNITITGRSPSPSGTGVTAALALATATAPVVAVSPIIAGKALKGPADRMLASLGHAATELVGEGVADPAAHVRGFGARIPQAVPSMLLDHRADLAAAISADFGQRSRHESELLEINPLIDGINHSLRHGKTWMAARQRAVDVDRRRVEHVLDAHHRRDRARPCLSLPPARPRRSGGGTSPRVV